MKKPLATTLLLLAACSTVPFPEHTPLGNESTRLFLHERLAQSQSRARLIERAIILVHGEEVVLTIYVESGGPDEFRIAAVSDLGATVFSVQWSAGEMTVLHESPGFSEDMLERFVPDQIAALLPPSEDEVQLVRIEDGRIALYYERFESEVLVSLGEDQGVLQVERGQGGDLCTTILLRGSGVAGVLEITTTDGSYSGHFELMPWQ